MKNGTIAKAAANPDYNQDQVGFTDSKVIPPSPARGTLGDMVRNAILGITVAAVIVVDFGRRKVGVYTHDAQLLVQLTGQLANIGLQYTVTPVDPAKSSLVWGVTDDGNGNSNVLTPAGTPPGNQSALAQALDASLGFGASAKSIAGLVNAVEDAFADPNVASEGWLMVDQNAKNCRLITTEDTSASPDICSPASNQPGYDNWVVGYEQTPDPSATSSGGPFAD